MTDCNGFKVVLNSLGRFVLQRRAYKTYHPNNDTNNKNAPNIIAQEFKNNSPSNVTSSLFDSSKFDVG